MQPVTVEELEKIISEYKAQGIKTKDLERKLKKLKKNPESGKVSGPHTKIINNPDGSRTITYSTGPIDRELFKGQSAKS